MDRYSPLREKMIGLRGGGLLLMGILVASLAMAAYVGLTVLLFLPLLGLRRMFPLRSTSSVRRWDGNAPVYSERTSGTRRHGGHDNDEAVRRQSCVRGDAGRSPCGLRGLRPGEFRRHRDGPVEWQLEDRPA